jgi:hypothetical protein
MVDTKPSEKDIHTSGSTMGIKYTEAKARNPKRAFLHIVTWKEMLPFIDELEETDILDKKDLPEDYKTTDDLDFSHSTDLGLSSPVIASIVERILITRKANLVRGDCIRLQFIAYRGYGTYFYDGSHVITAEEEDSDYERIPSQFKIPTEFPVDYWNDTGFVGYCYTGDYNFDTQLLNQNLQFKHLYVNDCLSLMIADIEINNVKWYIFTAFESGAEKELTAKQLKFHKKLFKQFLKDGKCHDLDKLDCYTTCEELDEALGFKSNDIITYSIVIHGYE